MAKTGKAAGEGSFEESLKQLESLVEQMESPELPLETIVEKYELGMKLVGVCSEKLKAAEKRITLLTKKIDGSIEESDLHEMGDESPKSGHGKKAGRGTPDLLI
jgi:exodeoxyribonuclease VII small subunit